MFRIKTICPGVAMLISLIISYGYLLQSPSSAKETGDERKPMTHVVSISKSRFSPSDLSIRLGDTVVWKNLDVVPHTATGNAFDSGKLNKGQSWSFKARRKGVSSYICTYHPSMKGRLTVR